MSVNASSVIPTQEGQKRQRLSTMESARSTTAPYTHPISSSGDTQLATRLLCVPLSFLFRTSAVYNPDSTKLLHLLSKAEVSIFLRVHCLASQLDHLLQLSYEAIYRTSICRYLSSILTQQPFHRAWLPILHMHGMILPQQILHDIPIEMNRIIHKELYPLIQSLRDLADQNWNYVQLLQPAQTTGFPSSSSSTTTTTTTTNTTDDGGASSVLVPTLAREKSVIAQVQEVLALRIETLIQKGFVEDDSYVVESMEDLCLSFLTQAEQYSTLGANTMDPLNSLGLQEDHVPTVGITTKEMDMTVESKCNSNENCTTTGTTPHPTNNMSSQASTGEEGWAQIYG